MENKRKSLSSNSIITGLMTIAYAVVMGLLYAYYYDLNDDVLMKDILSGVFTGSPEAHNIQMLYPVSLLISIFYKVYKGVDCYGLYLLLCQYVSLFVIADYASGVISDAVLLRLEKGIIKEKEYLLRIPVVILILLVLTAFIPGHLLFVQYTFAVAMMCSAAAVLIHEKKDVAAVLFIILAFLTRSEMTLLMLPFVLLVLFYRAMDEREFKRDVYVALGIVAGLLISLGCHYLGYSSSEWREFISFFNSRTDIYDFYQIPDYDKNRDFYESIDLKKSEYELLVNYNFGLDEKIDADKMAKIAEYSKSIWKDEGLLFSIKKNLPLYFYRLRHLGIPKGYEYPMTDAPWNIYLVLMYVVCIVLMSLEYTGVKNVPLRVWLSAWKLLLLFGGRTLLWMYIMVRGRDPIRITHSLYLIEITVLVLTAGRSLIKFEKRVKHGSNTKAIESVMPAHVLSALCLIILVFSLGIYVPVQLKIARNECDGRAEYNRAYLELEDYFRSNKDKIYLMDVYTSVSYKDDGYTYSQRMFSGVNNELSNSVMLGGWASGSPAEKIKLHNLGCDEKMSDIVFRDDAFIVADKDTAMDWLKDYYKEIDTEIDMEAAEEVAGEFVIWKVNKKHD